jgi:membrane protein DedA with SNARE-associated domain
MDIAAYSDAVLAFVREYRALMPIVVFILAFGESLAFVSLIFPFWGMLVALGALVGASGSLDFWLVMTAAAVGAALGDWLSYWLGYHYHDQIARMWPLNRYPDLLPKGRKFFDKWGAWAIVIGRFSGPLRASVPIVAGAVEMPAMTFQIANWTSAFLWAFVLLAFGDGLAHTWTLINRYLGLG